MANAWSMEAEELTCGNRFEKTEDINRCLSDALIEAENYLVGARQGLLKSLDDARAKLPVAGGDSLRSAQERINSAQEAWRAYRDANCAYYEQAYAAIGESSSERIVCQLRATRQRLRELREETQFWIYKFKNP